MKTEWDYTQLAAHYLKRPDYAGEVVDALCRCTATPRGASVCDIGAGSGHLTKLLLDRGYQVTAVEPNEAMRQVGQGVTRGRDVRWVVGTGENTGIDSCAFDLVTFGSSFNTTDRQAALKETFRLLKPHGWFACLWNHRDLEDPLQREVEEYIRERVSGYGYGTRREDQTEVIRRSGLFAPALHLEGSYVARVNKEDYLEAWRSHATLQRQAANQFGLVIAGIEAILARSDEWLHVSYTTRCWMARRKD